MSSMEDGASPPVRRGRVARDHTGVLDYSSQGWRFIAALEGNDGHRMIVRENVVLEQGNLD